MENFECLDVNIDDMFLVDCNVDLDSDIVESFNDKYDYLTSLNDAQFDCVFNDEDKSVLVLAGAGSGKTRVLTNRIALLCQKYKVKPANILAMTFTNKAANEMQQRLSSLIDCSDMWICTIHSMCTRILRQDITNLNDYLESN